MDFGSKGGRCFIIVIIRCGNIYFQQRKIATRNGTRDFIYDTPYLVPMVHMQDLAPRPLHKSHTQIIVGSRSHITGDWLAPGLHRATDMEFYHHTRQMKGEEYLRYWPPRAFEIRRHRIGLFLDLCARIVCSSLGPKEYDRERESSCEDLQIGFYCFQFDLLVAMRACVLRAHRSTRLCFRTN